MDNNTVERQEVSEEQRKNGGLPLLPNEQGVTQTGQMQDRAPANKAETDPEAELKELFIKLGLDDQYESFEQLGRADASEVKSQFATAERFEIDRMILRAKLLGKYELAVRDYLSGYGQATNRQRAAEARAIFDAMNKDAAKVVAAREAGNTWGPLVKLCREIRGIRPGGGRNRGKSITDKGTSQIADRIKVAKPEQAEQIADAAIAQIVNSMQAKGGWEMALVEQTSGIAERLKTSKQAIFQDFGLTLVDMCNELVDRAKAEYAKDQTKKGGKPSQEPNVPQPAMETHQDSDEQSERTGTHG